MKTSIEHLPKKKQDQLRHIVGILTEQVDAEMIILFGSYARGDWVEELAPDRHHYQYQSDYDIFVLVRNRKVAKRVNRRQDLRDLIRRQIQTPISLISESVGHFNYCLRQGQYFYCDIEKEGILLYDSKKFKLEEARELSIEERKSKAEKYFEQWFNSSKGFFKTYLFNLSEKEYKIAAFQLHQATERFYSAILLVFTDYKPKTHDIEELGRFAAAQEPKLLMIFPKGSEKEKQRFELLRKSYVEARYNENFSIAREDLEWLAERVSKLQQLTSEICNKKIASFELITR